MIVGASIHQGDRIKYCGLFTLIYLRNGQSQDSIAYHRPWLCLRYWDICTFYPCWKTIFYVKFLSSLGQDTLNISAIASMGILLLPPPSLSARPEEWKETTARGNREAVISLIRNGTMRGYLAYSGAKPVGWCNAGPRIGMTTVPEYDEPEADQIGSIMCFVVAKEHRRQGIARQLLGAACNGFAAQGLTIAEGYPLKEAQGDAEYHCGPLSLYLSAGFKRYREDEDVIVVRRSVV